MSKILREDLKKLGIDLPDTYQKLMVQNASKFEEDFKPKAFKKPVRNSYGDNSMSFNEAVERDYRADGSDSEDHVRPRESSSDSQTQESGMQLGNQQEASRRSPAKPKIMYDERYLSHVLGIERPAFQKTHNLTTKVELSFESPYNQIGLLLPNLSKLSLNKSNIPNLNYLGPQSFQNLQILSIKHCDLTDISDLCKFPNLDMVYASFNLIDTLPNDSMLSLLDVEGNFLQMNSVAVLKTWPRLTDLYLEENPLAYESDDISDSSSWKLQILAILPKLRKLDGKDVKTLMMSQPSYTTGRRQQAYTKDIQDRVKQEELKRRFIRESERLDEDQSMLLEFGRKYVHTGDMEELDRIMQEIDERTADHIEEVSSIRNPNIRVKRITNSRQSDSVERRTSYAAVKQRSHGSVAPVNTRNSYNAIRNNFVPKQNPRSVRGNPTYNGRGMADNTDFDALHQLETDIKRPIMKGQPYTTKNQEQKPRNPVTYGTSTTKASKMVGFGAPSKAMQRR